MRAMVAILVGTLLAGCASDEGQPPTDSTPTPTATPSPEPPGPSPTPEPTPAADVSNASESAAPYVEPVFTAQEKVEDAADPGAFADVNPFEYQNPWRG